MTENGQAVDRSGYLEIRSRVATTFHLDARFPDQVFTGGVRNPLFGDFADVADPEFWPALSAMAQWHGDTRVGLLVLGPDLDECYLPYRGTFPAVSLSVDADEDEYWAAIGWDDDNDDRRFVDSIAVSSRVVAVTGPSGKWGCWGERDPEIAVHHGFPDPTTRTEWRRRFGPFDEVAETLRFHLPVTFRGSTVPPEHARTLTANYGPEDDRG
ncbi:hypothetical protein GCM10022243_67080 [Saccharothrix violaceirubra]|uniref:Uncharacterized protein n=1 Tax=Saccharothrix violaceirubra TaxID=413306 RepID=A0A7W7WVN6_9PSEU|nr:hypothetical protein [Saccharothrix violaceirubra]MBB4965510.1 hypothetical protein [Saccharothrix violaceirubra]